MVIKNFSIIFMLLALAANVQAKPLVLASIKPLALIAEEIAGSAADVDTLLPVIASPHDYPLKVSDYSRLQKADIVLWVGAELESFLQKPLANLASDRVMGAYDLPDLYWPLDNDESHQAHHHERDPHLWLDPRNAVAIARHLSARLIFIDPTNRAIYSANMRNFAIRMADLDQLLLSKLSPLAGRGFAVYHEGYSHFVSRYGLRQLDYVTFTPEQRPGAKHLQQLRQTLAREGKCLFLEPLNQQSGMRDLAKELKLNTGVLDALGEQVGEGGYAELMVRMAEAFVSCLSN